MSNTDLTTNKYAPFDALSMRDLIIEKLNASGNFTDQLYPGSNLSALTDVFATCYHVLMYYLNQTASESRLTQAQLYENVNEIVRLLGYNPTGYQTPKLSFNATSNLDIGLYTIPRYSFVKVGSIIYSTGSELTLQKSLSGTNEMVGLEDDYLLLQGKFIEHPIYTARGDEFEVVYLLNEQPSGAYIDHSYIHVYVKSNNKWSEFQRTTSLFFENSTAKKYEVRLNANGNYEIKFGNGTFGKKLNKSDQVAIYYLRSDGDAGVIGPGVLNSVVYNYSSNRFDEIASQINIDTSVSGQSITLTNNTPSTPFGLPENVEQIKTNAIKSLFSSRQLVTKSDYEVRISNTFSSFIKSYKIINNREFIEGHQKDLQNLGINNILDNTRVFNNLLEFGSTNTVGNVYIYAVPAVYKGDNNHTFLSNSQKSYIISELNNYASIGQTIVVMDPVYTAVDIGSANHIAGSDQSELYIELNSNIQRSWQNIKKQIIGIITNYFNVNNLSLGMNIDVNTLYANIKTIPEIKEIWSRHKPTGLLSKGITFCVWDPLLPNETTVNTSQSITLPYYKFPYYIDLSNLNYKITNV